LREGGGAIAAAAAANAIAEQGVPVAVVGADGSSRARLSPLVEYAPLPGTGKIAFATVVWNVARTIRQFRPTVIHVHGAAFAITTRTAAFAAGRRVPQVMTHHSAVLLRVPAPFSPVGALFVRNFSDHLISLTDWNKPYLERIAKRKVPVTCIPNFIDVNLIRDRLGRVNKAATKQEFGIPPEAMVVSFIARLVPGKGVETFVRTIAEYGGNGGPAAVGLVVGDGPLAERAQVLAQELRAPMRFVGYQQDVAPCLAITDIAVFPSEREVLPTVILEAAAAGLPIVCSDIPGHREIIADNVNGLLVSQSGQYAQFIKLLLEDRERATRLGQYGLETVLNRFDKPKVLPQLLALYRSLENGT
jgi:glycosyltransferase involved in cell wall biosynthesis